jgi:hypothetical protein
MWGRSMRRGLTAMFASAAGLAAIAAPASADHHLVLISEVFPGGVADTSFVELQAYETNQNLLATHHVVVYGPTGAAIDSYTFPANVESSESQRTVLLGDSAAAGSPDFTDSGLNIPTGGGAVCFISDTYPDNTALDCVTWGNFTGTVPDVPTGSPASPGGVSPDKSLQRRIDRGCATFLDLPQDNTFDSATDFTEETPSPRNNFVAPTEVRCPETRITSTPVNPNNSTTATLGFDSPGNTNPVPPGLSFKCKLDQEPDFSACASPKTYLGPLDPGTHTFSVKAVLNGVEDPTPISFQWTIDHTPPNTAIVEASKPANPTAEPTADFEFTSTELNSTFTCKLNTGAEEACNSGLKGYSALPSGSYTFTVFATDRAGNKDDSAATYAWVVDQDPPDTVIDSGPQQPTSTVNSASFTYHSEAGATFLCKLDALTATACDDPSGISYGSLSEGSHTFRVHSTDALGNSEGLAGAAIYTWTVDAVSDPPPNTTITKPPKRKGTDTTPTIAFTASVSPATFQCRVDDKPYAPCTSPHTTARLKRGRHTFDVFAAAAGGDDATPAQAAFKIVRKR